MGKTLVVGIMVPLLLISGAITKMAMDWEDAFAVLAVLAIWDA